MSQKVLDRMLEGLGKEVVESTCSHRGDETATIRAGDIARACRFLKDDPECSFEMLSDVTCVDWIEEEPRFEIVYHLYSVSKKHRVRLKARVSIESPTLPTVTGVWRGADWFEREVYDMYGILFEGHPNLRRILLYPEFEGHPLRKDYPLNGEQPLTELRDPDTGLPVMPEGSGRIQGKQA